MNLEPTAEQEALRATVRRCLAEEASIADAVRPVAGGAAWVPDRAWKRLAGLGAAGLVVAEEHGGSGLGMVEAAMVAEELGRALYPGPWVATAVAAARLLAMVDGGAELLAAVADGSTIAAAALPAPDLGGASPRLGTRVEGGRLVGREAHVLGAPAADVLLVPADDGGTTRLFAVDATAAGTSVTPDVAIDRTVARGLVDLDGAPGRALGPIAPDRLATVTDDVLVALGADALGCAQAVLDLAVAHAKVRHQFGQPIGAFQAVQHLCVDMHETVELARGGVLHAAWAADAGEPATRHLAALRLKAFADRLATVGDTAIQVLGGIGFTWEHDAHLHLRRLLTWSSLFGAAGAYRVAVGRAVAGPA